MDTCSTGVTNGRGSRSRGITRGEVILSVIAVLIALVLIIPMLSRSRRNTQYLTAGSRLNGVMQGINNWAQDNRGRYPLPSKVDVNDATVAEVGAAKDTTSNIFAIMVWNQAITLDLLDAPRNAPWFTPYSAAGGASTRVAIDPPHACWDPSFSADFSGGQRANVGIAHVRPRGADERVSPQWRLVTSASDPILSERGAKIFTVLTTQPLHTTPVYESPGARMLVPRGRFGAWEGSVAFGDCHVEFALNPAIRALDRSDPGSAILDYLFYDERRDPPHVNDFLGIFRMAGETPAEFEAIWD